jgi:hypothetical protein
LLSANDLPRRFAHISSEIRLNCEGWVNTVHNIQARTPVENIIAMIRAVETFNGNGAA